MTQASVIVGIVFIVLGALSGIYGILLCYTTKGDYFNDEEVRIMLAREAAEERRRRIEEAEQDEMEQEEARKEEGKRKKRGIIIAS